MLAWDITRKFAPDAAPSPHKPVNLQPTVGDPKLPVVTGSNRVSDNLQTIRFRNPKPLSFRGPGGLGAVLRQLVQGCASSSRGFGVALTYTRPFGDHSYDGQPLVCRPIREELPAQRIVLAYDQRYPLTPPAEAFKMQAVTWFKERLPFTSN